MVARILAACGLWLGPEARLMPAKPDNPDGFFENLDLVGLNDELLERLEGGWDAPPSLPDGWAVSGLAGELIQRARTVIDEIAAGAGACPAWGWKDPRVCLVLPFWQDLLPDMRMVVCLRNPLAVAGSLRKRGNYSLRFGLRLWATYNQALLRHLAPDGFLVTHYDAWLVEPAAELRRILELLDWELPPQRIEAAAAFVKPDYRHHESGALDSLLALGGLEAASLYDALRARAGPVYARTAEGRHAPVLAADFHPVVGSADGAGDVRMELMLQRRRNAELAAALDASRIKPAFYRVGDAIDFRKGGNAPLYTREGWALPQDSGTWSFGDRSSLYLRLTAAAPGALRLVARLRPLVAPAHPTLSVQVLANGVVAADWVLDATKMTDVSAVVPAACVMGREEVSLLFLISEPRSPKDLGLSKDVRKLGLLLRDLRLEPPPS